MRRPLRALRIEGDERVTNLDQSGRERLEPRPVSRPPVDPASRRAFGRPDGVDGSFLGAGPVPRSGRVHPEGPAARPGAGRGVRPAVRGGDSLQRHPADAGALEAERDGRAPTSPTIRGAIPAPPRRWAPRRCPSTPPRRRPPRWASSACATCCSAAGCPTSRWRSSAIIALVIGVAGGWVGRKTAEVVEAFTTSKVTLQTSDNAAPPDGQFAKVAAAVADSVVTIEAISDRRARRAPASSSTAAATSSPTTTSSPRPRPTPASTR